MATKNTVGAVLINDSPVVTEATVSATSIDTSLPYMNLVGEWYVNGSKVITEATLPSGGGDSQATLDALINRKITEIESDVENVASYAFAQCSKLTIAEFPNANIMGQYVFDYCSSLTTVNIPNVKTIGSYSFRFCSKLPRVELPNATQINSSVFWACYSLTKVIIGINQTTVAKLSNTNAFNNCYHILGTVNATYNPTGAKDGYIYVPLSLVADYRLATNWATYASQIMPYVATVGELANIDGTTYDKACVGADYVEYTYNGTSWELYTRS